MSDTSQGPGWWQASDGKWYPPEQAPGGGAGTTAGAGTANVDIGGAFSYGWNKFTQNAGPLIVAVLVMWVLQLIVQAIGFGFRSLILRLIIGLVAVLSVPALNGNTGLWIVAVVIASFLLAAPASWLIAPRLRLRYWKQREAEHRHAAI